ncbi:hypothetical protein FSARC_5294 [Fusarium sarcochroum]|uniref:RNase III domain-containing protein n=1 Tax=Fusarium sarcochroum TaxID=1208366 RepID=A0A8H4TZX1_9HYPO|nr:hypothetical protein FSARC_5294 [Fusarium sarcochroum]
MSKRLGPASPDEGPRKRVQLSSPTSVPVVPSLVPGISPWSSSDVPTSLPPLPVISPELEAQVFRHPGLGGANYEKLEWYGDSVLEMISTELVFATFDHLPTGRSSQLREQLVRNITLAEYYRQYGMEKRTQLPRDMGVMADLIRTNPRDKDLIKIQGDIFEAYVGAVARSQNGTAKVVAWLKALWSRTIKDQIKQAEKHSEASLKSAQEAQSTTKQENPETAKPKGEQTPKDRLSQTLVVKGVKIRYEDMPCKKKDKNLGLPLFAIGAYLDGWGETNKLLGIGTALGKKEAGFKAATVALENRKLMKVYEDKKKAFLEEAKAKANNATA